MSECLCVSFWECLWISVVVCERLGVSVVEGKQRSCHQRRIQKRFARRVVAFMLGVWALVTAIRVTKNVLFVQIWIPVFRRMQLGILSQRLTLISLTRLVLTFLPRMCLRAYTIMEHAGQTVTFLLQVRMPMRRSYISTLDLSF